MNIGQLDQAVLCRENHEYGQVIDTSDGMVTVRTGLSASEDELSSRLQGLGTLKSLLRRRVIEPHGETVIRSPFERLIDDPLWSLVEPVPILPAMEREVRQESAILNRFHPLEPGIFSQAREYVVSFCSGRLPLDLGRDPQELIFDLITAHDMQLLLHLIGRGDVDSKKLRIERIDRLASQDSTSSREWEQDFARSPSSDLFILATSCLAALSRLREYEKGTKHPIDSILSSISEVETVLSTRIKHIRPRLEEYLTL